MTLLRRSHCFAEKHSDVAATSAVEAFAVFAAARSRIWSGDDTDVVSRVNRAGDYVLSPGHAHVARYSRDTIGPVNDEIMAFGFAGDRLSDRRIEKTIPFRGAEWGAQIGCVFVPQTHVKPACACLPPIEDPWAAKSRFLLNSARKRIMLVSYPPVACCRLKGCEGEIRR